MLDGQGRLEAAIECFHNALQVARDYVNALSNLALASLTRQCYMSAGKAKTPLINKTKPVVN
jgi:hypothetical protein